MKARNTIFIFIFLLISFFSIPNYSVKIEKSINYKNVTFLTFNNLSVIKEKNNWIVWFKENSFAQKNLKKSEPKKSFIIQLKGEPILKYKRTKAKTSHKIFSYKLKVLNTQKTVASILSKMGIHVKKKFYNVFNGMVVEASEEEIKKIKEMDQIKAVYPDKKLHILLNESVPLINADKVWNLKIDDANITGKNITIAIIDTGIDYTHPDLGNCTKAAFLNGICKKVIG